jgi:hypothetical protein
LTAEQQNRRGMQQGNRERGGAKTGRWRLFNHVAAARKIRKERAF